MHYLIRTAGKGLILNPTQETSFECFADADFCGLWNKDRGEFDSMTSKSRTGFVITYAGCPITWASKLQSLTALSSTEAEYIALSTSLRDQIPLMEMLKEVQAEGIDVHFSPQQPIARC